MLSAHMDTVPICLDCKPQLVGETIRSANPAHRGSEAMIALVFLRCLPECAKFWKVVRRIRR